MASDGIICAGSANPRAHRAPQPGPAVLLIVTLTILGLAILDLAPFTSLGIWKRLVWTVLIATAVAAASRVREDA